MTLFSLVKQTINNDENVFWFSMNYTLFYDNCEYNYYWLVFPSEKIVKLLLERVVGQNGISSGMVNHSSVRR